MWLQWVFLQTPQQKVGFSKTQKYLISDFRREVDEN
jgi:hypothetical protein